MQKIIPLTLLLFIGLCTFSRFLWVIKSVIENLPRDILFQPTEFWFHVILWITAGYLFALKNTIKPNNLPEALRNIREFPRISYILLDKMIKWRCYIAKYTNIILKYITPEEANTQTQLYILFHIIPRVIILIAFLRDVFWLHHLENFYYFILLAIFYDK